MKGIRFYKIISAVLLLINIGLIAFMWFGKPPHPPHPGDKPKLAIELGLTGNSKTEVDKLEVEHHKEKKKLMKLDQELHKQFFSLVGTNKDVSEIQNQLNENKEEIEKMTFDFFDEVAIFCNNEQLVLLHSFIENGVGRIGLPPPPKH